MSGFSNAPVSKAFLLSLCAWSAAVGAFSRQYYFNIPLVPHLSRDHQFWRLVSHHLAFANSSELLVGVILVYSLSITLERSFGSLKYASFLAVSALVTSIIELVALIAFYQIGLKAIPAGPFGLIFSLLYQYYRVVPASYQFRIASITFTNKSFTYFMALQLFLSQPFLSCIPCLCGVLTGAFYRADVLSIRSYRLPRTLVRFAERALGSFLSTGSSSRPQRRLNHASLDDLPAPQGFASAFAGVAAGSAATRRTPAAAAPPATANAGGTTATAPRPALREWAETFAGTAQARAQPPPSEEAIASLQAMFPAAEVDQVTAALRQSNNDVNRAVERLLSAS